MKNQEIIKKYDLLDNQKVENILLKLLKKIVSTISLIVGCFSGVIALLFVILEILIIVDIFNIGIMSFIYKSIPVVIIFIIFSIINFICLEIYKRV